MRLLSIALAVCLLAGCAPQVLEDTQPTATAWERPAVAFEVECDELVPIEDLRAIWGGGLKPVPYEEAGAQGSWEMQGTALLQDGALACRWTVPGKQSQITVLALDDAADGYERTESTYLDDTRFDYNSAEIADGAQTYCRTEDGPPRCHWNVLAGDAWISLFFEDVSTSELAPGGSARTSDTPLAEVAIQFINSIANSPRRHIEREAGQLEPCRDTLGQAEVAEALDVPIDELGGSAGRPLEYALGTSTPDFGQTMWAYSFERLDYYECMFGTASVTGSVITAPGAGWILDDPEALQGSVTEVEGLGRGIAECRTEGDFAICTVAIAVGQDLALVSLSPEDPADGLTLAKAVASLLVPRGLG